MIDELVINNLGIVFNSGGNRLVVFKEFEMSVKSGETLSVFGASGVGKTTLLNSIAGIAKPGFGTITPSGARVSFVFQKPGLLPWLTARNNIELAIKNIISDPQARFDKAMESLTLVEGSHLADSIAGNLSGGEAQRISLARALAFDPEILLLDEPFSHIDQILANRLRFMLKTIIKKLTKPVTLFVTHDPVEAGYFGDRIIVLKKISGQDGASISGEIKLPKISGKINPYSQFFVSRQARQVAKKLLSLV